LNYTVYETKLQNNNYAWRIRATGDEVADSMKNKL